MDSLGCGNGSDRTQHPIELLGDDWYEWYGLDDAGVARLLLAEEEERKRQPAPKKAPARVLPKL